ncbi:hypothetical protein [Acaricomes phytoseiuli]|uniref:hypothetical protein n=1 Tax=Acaricomes phytoseiuli TaxID=291968 RepID=UPI0003A85092|nr:hypothetical protein [Acaricomes phytoseiuli]
MAWLKSKNSDSGAGSGVDDRPFYQRPSWLVLAASAAVVVIAAVVLVLVKPFNQEQAPTSGASESSVTVPGEASSLAQPGTGAGAGGSDASVCGLSDGPEAVPSRAPTDVRWDFVDNPRLPGVVTAVPFSEKSGPGLQNAAKTQRSCFARTPTGALLAAANAWAGSEFGEYDFVINDLNAAGPGREALRTKFADPVVRQKYDADQQSQLMGFVIQYFTKDKAGIVLQLGIPSKPGYQAQLAFLMVWESGDWKVQTDASGVVKSTNLDPEEFIPWQGIRF